MTELYLKNVPYQKVDQSKYNLSKSLMVIKVKTLSGSSIPLPVDGSV